MASPVANRDVDTVDIGPGLLYLAPIGTSEPTSPDPTTWGTSWVEMGYTDNGSTFKTAPTLDDVSVAEELDPVLTIVTALKSTLAMDLAQITAFNLGIAFGGGTITTPSGLVTFEPPLTGKGLLPVMLGWIASAGDEAIVWRKCQPNQSLNLQRQKGNNKALINVEFTVLALSGVPPWIWIADNARLGAPFTDAYPSYVAPAPVISHLYPVGGAAAGGAGVTIIGTNFTGATVVKFGATNGTGLVVFSDSEIHVVAPAHAAGAVDVSVTTPAGVGTATGAFTYS
jgi:IPT/TIG domain